MSIFEDLFEGGHRRRPGRDGHHDSDDHDHDYHQYRGDERGDRAHVPAAHGSQAPGARCRACDATFVVLPGFRFCPFCGASLAPAACRSCGVVVLPGASFCQGCGQKL